MSPLPVTIEFGTPSQPLGKSDYRRTGSGAIRYRVTITTLITVLVTLVLSGCVTTPLIEKVSYSKTPVYFVTDRKAAKAKTLHTPFTAERGPLRYGQCSLSIPNSHKPGSIERPAMTDLQFSEDPNVHISLLSLGLNPRRHFYTTLNRHLRGMKNPRVLVFIHGYNTGFSDAAYRSAQLKNDLQFDGPVIFYSWPSQSATISYSIDVSNIRWSRPNM